LDVIDIVDGMQTSLDEFPHAHHDLDIGISVRRAWPVHELHRFFAPQAGSAGVALIERWVDGGLWPLRHVDVWICFCFFSGSEIVGKEQSKLQQGTVVEKSVARLL
jgi:hypothetical protein